MLKFTSFKRQEINLVFKIKVFVVSKIWYFNKSIYFYFPKIWVVTRTWKEHAMYVFSFSSQNLHLVSPIQPLLIILFLEAIALCEINHNQIFNHPLGCARVYYAGVVPG
jgi:hypothetical protein